MRNPVCRWGFWLAVGLILAIVTLTYMAQPTTPKAVLVLVLPFPATFFLAALVSYRAKLILTTDDLQIHALWEHKTFRWQEIENITVVRERATVNLISTSVTRYLQLRVAGRNVEVPAPQAGRFLGAADFAHKAETVHRIWLERTRHATGRT
jgi:hypothetical protein